MESDRKQIYERLFPHQVSRQPLIVQQYPNTPFTYTDISYESLRIANIHGSLRFGHFYDRFKSCSELLRVIYGLLRIFTSYYDVFTAKFYDLLRVVTDNYV